mgnify:CR=1 FL=1
MKKFKLSREVKIGIVVIVALGMLYFGLNYLKGINIFTDIQKIDKNIVNKVFIRKSDDDF